ncbi:MAG: hypothetical protein JO200_14175 [Comamonas sp.]|nr:hypothetical protein [Comamonas sp.]
MAAEFGQRIRYGFQSCLRMMRKHFNAFPYLNQSLTSASSYDFVLATAASPTTDKSAP